MKILFLGTGTSTGIPSLCCDCAVCLSPDPKNKRLRASILIRNDGFNTLVDTSTDLRQQCLIYGIRHIHSVLYTHAHADHIHGIDELRSFNFFNKTVIPCYGTEQTLATLKNTFSYIFNGQKPEGGGIPQLTLNPLGTKPFPLGGALITPLEVYHGSQMITGYKINNVAYITDCNKIPDQTKDKIKGLDLLILNALRYEPHATHFCLDEALAMVEELKPKRALLTHVTHQFEHHKVNGELPEHVRLAYDGLEVEL
jgi:phosphoribosyl 1,2-cyclic phosphate phosphodiesterase